MVVRGRQEPVLPQPPKTRYSGRNASVGNRPLVHHGQRLAGLGSHVDDDGVELGCGAAFATAKTGG